MNDALLRCEEIIFCTQRRIVYATVLFYLVLSCYLVDEMFENKTNKPKNKTKNQVCLLNNTSFSFNPLNNISRKMAGGVWCLPPVWNQTAVSWFHFAIPSLVRFFYLLLLFFLSFFLLFSAHGLFSWLFPQKILQYFSLRNRLLCMAPVQQPGDVSCWCVQHAAIWHWYLLLWIYIIYFLMFLFIPLYICIYINQLICMVLVS